MNEKNALFFCTIILIYLFYTIIAILFIRSGDLNSYNKGLLTGKIVVFLLFGILAYKTYPYKK